MSSLFARGTVCLHHVIFMCISSLILTHDKRQVPIFSTGSLFWCKWRTARALKTFCLRFCHFVARGLLETTLSIEPDATPSCSQCYPARWQHDWHLFFNTPSQGVARAVCLKSLQYQKLRRAIFFFLLPRFHFVTFHFPLENTTAASAQPLDVFRGTCALDTRNYLSFVCAIFDSVTSFAALINLTSALSEVETLVDEEGKKRHFPLQKIATAGLVVGVSLTQLM